MHTLILVQGSNLIRHDLSLRYRISPADLQTLKPALCVSPVLLEEWSVKYLIEEKVRQIFAEPLVPAFLRFMNHVPDSVFFYTGQPCYTDSR